MCLFTVYFNHDMPTMPTCPYCRSKKVTSSTAKVYTGLNFGASRTLKVSEVKERKRHLDEKKKNEELRKSQYLCNQYTHIDFSSTDMTSLLRQTIAELGTATNQVPGLVDWEVIPDVPIYDDPMDVDPLMGDWEDIFEKDPSIKGQMVGQGLMQHARLQTIITCVFLFFSLPFYISDCYCRAFGGQKIDSCQGCSCLLHRHAAEREWQAVMLLLVNPYLEWKHNHATFQFVAESDTV